MPLSEDEKAELVAYLDGELDEPAVQAIEARIATDPSARAELEELKQTWGMLDFLPKAEPSPNFTNRTMERLSLERVRGTAKTAPMPRPHSAWMRTAAWAAAILLALTGGYFGGSYLWPLAVPEDPIPDADVPLVRHLRIAEKWRYYENVEDIDFVKKLNHPDLFGEDPS